MLICEEIGVFGSVPVGKVPGRLADSVTSVDATGLNWLWLI